MTTTPSPSSSSFLRVFSSNSSSSSSSSSFARQCFGQRRRPVSRSSSSSTILSRRNNSDEEEEEEEKDEEAHNHHMYHHDHHHHHHHHHHRLASKNSQQQALRRRRRRTTRTTTATTTTRLRAVGASSAGEGDSSSSSSSMDFYDEIMARNDALVDIMLEKIRRRESKNMSSNGIDREETRGKSKETKVYLVGCGPGDPGLLTLKAYHLIVTADVILYDRLVSPEILEYAASATTNSVSSNDSYDNKNNSSEGKGLMLFVGKRSGFHTRTQDEIHDLILEFANAGATVVRLKGGDPLVFGRGGEECEFLREKGFDVKVIPGITAASGVGSSAGVPLTHRGVATSARLLTGHLMKKEKKKMDAGENVTLSSESPADLKKEEEKEEEGAVDFAVTAADSDTTLIIYMGLGTLPKTKKKLLQEGALDKRTPCLAVENGTTLKERRVFSTIEYIDEAVVDAQLQSPTLLFIGDAVRLSPYFPEALSKENFSSSSMRWELQVGQDEDENRMRHTPDRGGKCRIMSDINDRASREWFSKNFISEKLFSLPSADDERSKERSSSRAVQTSM